MNRRHKLITEEGYTGNSWAGSGIEDDSDSIRNLGAQDEGCPSCGFEGPLKLTRKGYRCPECREMVIPNNE